MTTNLTTFNKTTKTTDQQKQIKEFTIDFKHKEFIVDQRQAKLLKKQQELKEYQKTIDKDSKENLSLLQSLLDTKLFFNQDIEPTLAKKAIIMRDIINIKAKELDTAEKNLIKKEVSIDAKYEQMTKEQKEMYLCLHNAFTKKLNDNKDNNQGTSDKPFESERLNVMYKAIMSNKENIQQEIDISKDKSNELKTMNIACIIDTYINPNEPKKEKKKGRSHSMNCSSDNINTNTSKSPLYNFLNSTSLYDKTTNPKSNLEKQPNNDLNKSFHINNHQKIKLSSKQCIKKHNTNINKSTLLKSQAKGNKIMNN